MQKLLLFIAILLCFISTNAQNPVGIFENHVDIGNVLTKGTASYDNPSHKYIITSSGENMWFKKDEFHFAYKKLKGDFIITSQPFLEGNGGDAHRKAGLIARTGVDTSSAMVCLTVHGDGLTAFQFRKKNGTNTEEIKIPIIGAEVLQFERRGRSYFISVAKLGQPFWSVEVPDIDFPEELLVGLFVCAHNKNVVQQASFTNTRVFSAIK